MSQKTEMKYCRRGCRDTLLFLHSEDKEAGTCSLEDAEGKVRVTKLPLIAKPEEVKDLPPGYATPSGRTADRAPSVVDTEKVTAILSKFNDPDSEVTERDLERANLPTLGAIIEGLGMDQPPKGAKSEDIKQAILDFIDASASSDSDGGNGGTQSDPKVDTEKVDEILLQAAAPDAEVTMSDLDRVNLPTLGAIIEGLQMEAPAEGAKSADIKQAIIDFTAPADGGEGGGDTE